MTPMIWVVVVCNWKEIMKEKNIQLKLINRIQIVTFSLSVGLYHKNASINLSGHSRFFFFRWRYTILCKITTFRNGIFNFIYSGLFYLPLCSLSLSVSPFHSSASSAVWWRNETVVVVYTTRERETSYIVDVELASLWWDGIRCGWVAISHRSTKRNEKNMI